MASLVTSMLKSFWTKSIDSELAKSDKLDSRSSPASIDLRRLGTPSDLAFLPIIAYAYDPLPAQPGCLDQPSFQLPSGATATARNSFLSLNAVQLHPRSAGLPLRCSIDHVYASRFWKSNLAETVTLLNLLASDDSTSDIEVDRGLTVAKLARKALRPGLEHDIVLGTHYMFPLADEQRVKHISALMIYYFVFDDKVEETPDRTLHIFRDHFLCRLEGHSSHDSNPSALRSHMDELVYGIESEDAAGGDGGKEMLDGLRDAFRCVHPPDKGFQSLNEYLKFRRFNIGAAFVLAAAKYSVKSSVSLNDQRFERYFSLVGDHLGLVNDLASYDKELRALTSGETDDMINIVGVVKDVTSLKGTDDAKSVVWALQIQIERQMMEELEKLRALGLSDEEWYFLEAVTSTATGNVMFCMTSSRYGGQAAKIESGSGSGRATRVQLFAKP